jgi:uncharacterized protein
MRLFLPKQPTFFHLFRQLADKQVAIAELLKELSERFAESEIFAARAKEIEREADEITHEIVDRLNNTFVTPLDREDIYALTHKLDDIIDHIENTINSIRLYRIDVKRDELDRFADLVIRAAHETVHLVAMLETRRSSPEMRQLVASIHAIEDEGDALFQEATKKLFAKHTDPLEVIRWKDIFENLERIIDTYQQLSDRIEGVLVKAS